MLKAAMKGMKYERKFSQLLFILLMEFLNASLKLELGTRNGKGKGNSDQLAKIRNACNKKKEENISKEESMEMMQKQDEYLQSSIEMGSSSSSSLSNDGGILFGALLIYHQSVSSTKWSRIFIPYAFHALINYTTFRFFLTLY
jgi:hypothetical protein